MWLNTVRWRKATLCSGGFVLLALSWTAPCLGQDLNPDPDSIEETRIAIKARHQQIVSDAIDMTQEEEIAFWPLYREWRAKMAGIGDRIVKLVELVEEDWDQVDDAQARTILDDWLKIQAEELALKKRYLKRFRKILPDKKVTRFYQLENKLDVAVNYNLATTVPLVE